jgi:DUF917 family protein
MWLLDLDSLLWGASISGPGGGGAPTPGTTDLANAPLIGGYLTLITSEHQANG